MEILKRVDPRKTSARRVLCEAVARNSELRFKFKISNIADLNKYLGTRSYGLILSAIKALSQGRAGHSLFDDYKSFREGGEVRPPRVIDMRNKSAHQPPVVQLSLFKRGPMVR